MKFIATRSALESALKTVSPAVDGRSLQVLTMVRLEVVRKDGGEPRLALAATNLNQSIVTDCDLVGADAGGQSDAGSVLLPHGILSRIVAKLPDGQITVSVSDDDKATISASGSKFKLAGLPSKEFPALPRLADDDYAYTFKAETLVGCLRRTAYAASADETRRVLMGVLFSFSSGCASVRFAATDGRRLVTETAECESVGGRGDFDVVVPSQSIAIIRNAAAAAPKDSICKIGIATTQACFEFAGTTVFTKLVDEVYPNVMQVIPANYDGFSKAAFDRVAFLAALDRVSAVGSENDTHTVRVEFGDGLLKFRGRNGDNEAIDEIPVKYDGEKMEVIFDSRYLAAPFKTFGDDEAAICLQGAQSPAVVVAPSVPSYVSVIMPLRVG